MSEHDYVVNERTRKVLTFTFQDDAGDPANPPVTYRVDDSGGTEVVAPTNATPTGGSLDIVMLPDPHHAILNQYNHEEIRVITVTANPGTADEVNEVRRGKVVNLKFVE